MSERTYKLQKGDQVVMHTCMEHDHPDNFGKIWTCRSDEFQHKGHDYGSIFLEGFSGSFSTEFLQKVDVSALVDSLQQQTEEYGITIERQGQEMIRLQGLVNKHLQEVGHLREQLAERDRTIALLTEEQKPKKWEVVNTVYFNDGSNQIYGYKVKNEDNTMRRIISSKTANELTLKGELIFSPRQELSLVSVDRDYIEKALGE
ncbi:hypothetical protein L8C07_12405 [Paenibacillus sp. CMAA1739]|uniref:hypothetical protein n=1 Tax=Paenibacillus ottowii TaxID=2315729 RepID=UPI002DB9D3FC|nr:hypothetical protein [Paenibacillus sp. CMAA1739]MEC4566749.1 hypothetical protein [Paenibacillus sp. CMAA1739]